jgi:hypothetical protein
MANAEPLPPPPPLDGYTRVPGGFLGAGASGRVYQERDNASSNALVAVKYVPLALLGPNFERELENLRRVDSPFVARLFRACVVRAPGGGVWGLAVVTELCEGPQLLQWVNDTWEAAQQAGGRVDENTLRAVFVQVLQAVADMHAKDIAHRDVKARAPARATRATQASCAAHARRARARARAVTWARPAARRGEPFLRECATLTPPRALPPSLPPPSSPGTSWTTRC